MGEAGMGEFYSFLQPYANPDLKAVTDAHQWKTLTREFVGSP
jgi:hypothetical protein